MLSKSEHWPLTESKLNTEREMKLKVETGIKVENEIQVIDFDLDFDGGMEIRIKSVTRIGMSSSIEIKSKTSIENGIGISLIKTENRIKIETAIRIENEKN
ncbi:hypothetical protein EVAR_29382_1 [Eumeta japonica]|uniref:Uncharacterized protein n=1 Tax=Eumeta variegata TaxID=151549 RepID=A0A4C1YFR1_EUMVA|nr:hypothetical protein EVAR_29382_1 [Eumeta japonica]